MTSADQIRDDLDYVASAVRRQEQFAGIPAIYFLWAAIVPVGFALPEFVPEAAGAFWFVAGIGGGLLSWWMAERHARRHGINDRATGMRHGLHWLIVGAAFLLSALPLMTGRGTDLTVANFLLVAGLAYALAGVHLQRPMLWSGLLMLAAYGVLVLFSPPYAWTITGVVIGISLALAGLSARRALGTDGA